MTVKEALAYLGIGRTLFYKYVGKGYITPERNELYAPGKGPVRLRRSEVEALRERVVAEQSGR